MFVLEFFLWGEIRIGERVQIKGCKSCILSCLFCVVFYDKLWRWDQEWERLERFRIPYLHVINNNTQGRILYYAKSFAYYNYCPGDCAHKRWTCAPFNAIYSSHGQWNVWRPAHPSHEEAGFEAFCTYFFALVWACPRPERFRILYLHVINNNTQGRILYCFLVFRNVLDAFTSSALRHFNTNWVKTAYEPSGPSGRRLSPVSVAWSD